MKPVELPQGTLEMLALFMLVLDLPHDKGFLFPGKTTENKPNVRWIG